MAATSAARKPRDKGRPMSKADICNLEPLGEVDKQYLSDAGQLVFTEVERERIEAVDAINKALRGLLEVCPYDHDRRDAARGYINAQDGRFYENGNPLIEFNLDRESHVSSCDGDVIATVLHHLRRNIAEHKKLLDEVVKRFQAVDLLGFDDDGTTRWTLEERGQQ